MLQENGGSVPAIKKPYTSDDHADPNPFPVEATVRPKGRWGAVGLWLIAAALALGVAGVYGLFLIAERLRQVVVALEAR